MTRDRDLAHRMLEEMKLTSSSSYCHPNNHGGTKGIILGGHEHEPMDETITDQESSSSIRILKTGADARLAALVEWTFDHTHNTGDPSTPPALLSVDVEFVDLSEYANSPSVQTLVDKKIKCMLEFCGYATLTNKCGLLFLYGHAGGIGCGCGNFEWRRP
eukprot:scaffold65810_cov37-Attheya_sp.AAC.4